MGEQTDRERTAAMRHPIASERALLGRNANRMRGWAIAIGASLVLWAVIVTVVWAITSSLS